MTSSRARIAAAIVVVVAFVALAALALVARSYEPGRDGVPVPSGSLGLVPVVPAQSVAASRAASPAPTPSPRRAPSPAPAPTRPAADPPPPPAPGTSSQLAPCELGLAVPDEQAGLANVVGIVPLFGPFSPEAFAMTPAFAPGFALVGPMMIAGGEQLDARQEELALLVSVLRPLQDQGFDALSPLYSPYRPQVLAAEAEFAARAAPVVAALAGMPGATCMPAALALIF